MLYLHHVKNLLSLYTTASAQAANGILTERAFFQTLERERARSDRYGDIFSLLIFETGTSNGNKTNELVLVDILSRRLRPTDEVGWFKKARLGVILPSTPYNGALKLADDICQKAWTRNVRIPAYEVFTYPPEKGENVDTGLQSNAHEKKECAINQYADNLHQNAHIGNGPQLAERFNPLFKNKLPAWKRGIDIIGSFLGLLFLSPLFLAIAILIKIVSPGPIFFSQKRVGFLGRPFTMYKFRTMQANADTALHENHITECVQNGKPLRKMDDQDPRIIPMGRFLRVTGIDELPQLFNVLRGEMSLIGPRPELYSSMQYCEYWHTRRFETKPGLSGLWQISGKTTTTFTEMMRLDISYVKKRSFWFDILILIKTLPTIISEAKR